MTVDNDTEPRSLVIMITHGIEDELSSVAFTIANGGITSGLRVSIFLTSSVVDLKRLKPIEKSPRSICFGAILSSHACRQRSDASR